MRKKIGALLLAGVMLMTGCGLFGCDNGGKTLSGGAFTLGNLQVESMENPLGIDDEKPRFSWTMASDVRGTAQKSYRIVVATGEDNLKNGTYVWDSGVVESDVSVEIPYGGDALTPATRYYWQVEVTGVDGSTVTSETALFETGLMETSALGDVKFLAAGERVVFDVEPAPLFRKEFTLSKDVQSARLYATAAGVYEAYINGQKTTDSYLNPGRNNYNKTIAYQTFDVTALLKKGDNAIGVVLGHGWWNRAGQNYGSILAFGGKLVVTYTDGSTETIVTDGSWQYYGDGPVRNDDIYMGETYDATKEVAGWAEPGLNTAAWMAPKVMEKEDVPGFTGTIEAQRIPLTVEYDLIQAKSVNTVTLKDGTKAHVYDFGQNVAGIVRLVDVKAPAGTTIKIRHGEKKHEDNHSRSNMDQLDSVIGTVWTRNLNNGNSAKAESTDYYTFKGDQNGETFEPSLLYHGFQYAQIEGVETAFPIEQVFAVVMATDLEQTGTIETSNENVNKYAHATLWSQIDNFLSVPTDCPQRNERFGWTGDAQVYTRTAAYFMDINAFFEKFSEDMVDTQRGNGNFPEAAPGWSTANPVAGWTDGGVLIPWNLYKLYGNKQVLIDNYEAMKKYIVLTITATGGDYIDDEHTTYGDWLGGQKTPKVMTESAWAAYTCGKFVEIAEILGMEDDVATFQTHYDNFVAAWQREFVKADGSLKCDPAKYGTGEWGNKDYPDTGEVKSQTAYVLALAFDLIPEDLRANTAKLLADNVVAGEYKIRTGFLGVSLILPTLTENGYADVAYKMMEREEYMSWLWSIVHGANTIYEAWHGYTEEYGKVSYTGSLNHYSYGSATEWLYRYVAGIERDDNSTAYKHFILQPTPGGTLTYAKASYRSAYGTIASYWHYEGEDFVYEVTVPANTTATLYLPAGSSTLEGKTDIAKADGVSVNKAEDGTVTSYELQSGKYVFTVKK